MNKQRKFVITTTYNEMGIIIDTKVEEAQPEHNPDDEIKIADLHKMVNYLLSRLEQQWILCVDGNEPKANAECWISTNAKYVRRASYAPKANNQPNGFIVTDDGFGFYEYGKGAVAWMPYYSPYPEPYKEEGEYD